MKFETSRETLLKPLQQVVGVVERRQTMPVLSNVLIQAEGERIRLTGTDLEVELSAQIRMPAAVAGAVTVPARKLFDICRSLPEAASVVVEAEPDRVTVRSGKSRFRLMGLPADNFPLIDEVKAVRSFSLAQQELRELIERTHFSMAQQDVRYYLNGLLLELDRHHLRTVATDGHRLALCELPIEAPIDGVQQVIVPRKGVQELLRILEPTEDQVNVQIGLNHIRVSLPDVRLTSKLIDGRFPDYKRVLPTGGDKELVADRDSLRQALARASILSNEKYRGVRLSLGKDRLSIQAHNPEQEEAEEEMEVEYRAEPIDIGFNVTYLMDALSAVPGGAIVMRLSDANSSCLIQDASSAHCKYVVMPMRL